LSISIRVADAEHFANLLAGVAPAPGIALPASEIAAPEILAMLADLAATVSTECPPAAWMILDGSRLVGLCSLVRAPQEGVLTIGYGVAPSEQGKGAATGGIGALLEWARRDPRVRSLAAETNKANLASQRVLERNHFEMIGERVDEEDGDLLCWKCSVSENP
jgi:RimJ/RimL family protein N-acetyltransferase